MIKRLTDSTTSTTSGQTDTTNGQDPVRSSPLMTTMRFLHSSLMNKSLGESSKFAMSPLSMNLVLSKI